MLLASCKCSLPLLRSGKACEWMLVRMTSTSGKVMLGQCTARFLQVRDAIKFSAQRITSACPRKIRAMAGDYCRTFDF